MIAPSIEKRLRELARNRPRQINSITSRARATKQLLKYKMVKPIALLGFFTAGMVVGGVEHKIRPRWRPQVGSWFTTAMRTAVTKILFEQGQEMLDAHDDKSDQGNDNA